MKTCWDILKIEITLDKKTIKKTYAGLLRIYHPQKDPEGFQRLKQAYDEALNLASTLTIKDINKTTKEIHEENFQAISNSNLKNKLSTIEKYDTSANSYKAIKSSYPDKSENFHKCIYFFESIYENFDNRFLLISWETLFKYFNVLEIYEVESFILLLIKSLIKNHELDLASYEYINKNFKLLEYMEDIHVFNALSSEIDRNSLASLLTYLRGSEIAISSIFYKPLLGNNLNSDEGNETQLILKKSLHYSNREILLLIKNFEPYISKNRNIKILKLRHLYLNKKIYSEQEFIHLLHKKENDLDLKNDISVLKADFEFDNKNFNNAAILYSSALAEISSNRIAYKLALCYMQTNCYDIAKDILDDLVEQSPHNILFQIKYKKCINSILKHRIINIEEIGNTIYQLELLYAAKENEKIINIVDEYSEKTQNFKLLGKFSFYKAKALMRCGEVKGAFTCFNEAYEYAKTRTENTYEEALEILTLSIRYNDLDSDLIADPEALLLEALAAFPERDNIPFLLGEIYRANKDDPSQAIIFYTKALEKNNENFLAYDRRARTYYDLKKYDKCIDDSSRVIKQFCHEESMLILRAHAYFNVSSYKKAMNSFEYLFKLLAFEDIKHDELNIYFYSCKRHFNENYDISPHENDTPAFLKTNFSDEHLDAFKRSLPYCRLYLEKIISRKPIYLDEIFNIFSYLMKIYFLLNDYDASISTAREGFEYLDRADADYRYHRFYTAHYCYVIGECYYRLNEMACAVNAFTEIVNMYGTNVDSTIIAARERLGDIILYREYEYNVSDIHHHYNYCISAYKALGETLEDKSLKPHNEIIAQLYARMANNPLDAMTNEDIADYHRSALAYAEETDERYDYHRSLINHYIYSHNFGIALQELDFFYKVASSSNNVNKIFAFHEIKACCLIEMRELNDAYNEYETCLEISANFPENIYYRFNILIDQAYILYHHRDHITKTYNEALEITEKFYNEISSTDKEGHTYQILTFFIQQLLINAHPKKAIKLIEKHAGNDNEFMPDLLKEAQQLIEQNKERK